MQNTRLITLTVALLTIATTPASVAKDNTNKPQAANATQVFAKYDTDKNGVLNVTEGAAVASDYASNPQDPLLKRFDTDKDGKLSDKELMAIQARFKTANKQNKNKKL